MTLGSDALAIVREGIRSVDPGRCVLRSLRRRASGFSIGAGAVLRSRREGVHVVALGKAAGAMVDATVSRLGRDFAGGVAVLREGYPRPRSAVEILRGEHPIPGTGSVHAARRLLTYVGSLGKEDIVLFLISGGGSAIVELPVGDVSLSDLRRCTQLLMGSGAPIQGMNVVRRHLSQVKGGRLAKRTQSGSFATLAISDVVGDTPYDIASGPTVADPTTYDDAISVLERYRLTSQLPRRILRHLERGRRGGIPETPKPGDRSVERGRFELVGSNRTALETAGRKARRLGYRPWVLSSEVTGETRDVARLHAAIVRELAGDKGPLHRPFCLLSGGETTVTLGPKAGRGGRNQEFALAGADPIARVPRVLFLSVGTDGVDGTTNAAGGWVDGGTLDRARRLGINVNDALLRHATFDALTRLGGLVRTGPTGTNVMDLHVAMAATLPQSRYGRK